MFPWYSVDMFTSEWTKPCMPPRCYERTVREENGVLTWITWHVAGSMFIALARLKPPQLLVPWGFGMSVVVAGCAATWLAWVAVSMTWTSFSVAFCASEVLMG